MLIVSAYSGIKLISARDWPFVEGQIVEETFVLGKGSPSTSARVVEYKYVVSDVTYHGDREHFGISIACNKCPRRYSHNEQVKVYYDVNDPSDSVLLPDEAKSIWFGVILSLVFMAFSFFSARCGLKRPNKTN